MLTFRSAQLERTRNDPTEVAIPKVAWVYVGGGVAYLAKPLSAMKEVFLRVSAKEILHRLPGEVEDELGSDSHNQQKSLLISLTNIENIDQDAPAHRCRGV